MTIAKKRVYKPRVKKTTMTTTNFQRKKVFKDLEEAKKYAKLENGYWNIAKITNIQGGINQILTGHSQDYFWFEYQQATTQKVLKEVWQKVSGSINTPFRIPEQKSLDKLGSVVSTTPAQIIDLNPSMQKVEIESQEAITKNKMGLPLYLYVILDEIKTINSWQISADISQKFYEIINKKQKDPNFILDREKDAILQSLGATKTLIPKTGSIKLSRISDKNIMTATQTTFFVDIYNIENELLIISKLSK